MEKPHHLTCPDHTRQCTNVTEEPLRYVFVLLDQFSYLTFSCAIETLRLANGYNNNTYYQWDVLSETGKPVCGSNGLTLNVNGPLRALARNETLIICGGDNIAKTTTPRVVAWLCRNATQAARFGGISTGAFALAKAGLLSGTKATLHWEYHDSFRELFSQIELLDTIYYIDGNRFTCAGCAASMDLMLHLIADELGREQASYVSDLMVYTSPRTFGHSQRKSMTSRYGTRHPKLVHCLEIMSERIEDPISSLEIAMLIDISVRQLERLFRKFLNTSPNTHYTSLRLERARALLLQTELSVAEVCVASGFSSQQHFTNQYRKKYGVCPNRDDGIRSDP